MKPGDVVEIWRDLDDREKATMIGTATVERVDGHDLVFKSLPAGVQKGDLVVYK